LGLFTTLAGLTSENGSPAGFRAKAPRGARSTLDETLLGLAALVKTAGPTMTCTGGLWGRTEKRTDGKQWYSPL